MRKLLTLLSLAVVARSNDHDSQDGQHRGGGVPGRLCPGRPGRLEAKHRAAETFGAHAKAGTPPPTDPAAVSPQPGAARMPVLPS